MDKSGRFDYLKKRNNEQVNQAWHTNSLFTECLDLLGNDVAVFSFEKTNSIRTNYSNIKYHATNQSMRQILNENKKEYFYVFWDADRVPAICAPFEKIYNNLDYVIAVGFDTYVISINYRVAIVFDHNNKTKIQKQFYDY